MLLYEIYILLVYILGDTKHIKHFIALCDSMQETYTRVLRYHTNKM